RGVLAGHQDAPGPGRRLGDELDDDLVPGQRQPRGAAVPGPRAEARPPADLRLRRVRGRRPAGDAPHPDVRAHGLTPQGRRSSGRRLLAAATIVVPLFTMVAASGDIRPRMARASTTALGAATMAMSCRVTRIAPLASSTASASAVRSSLSSVTSAVSRAR